MGAVELNLCQHYFLLQNSVTRTSIPNQVNRSHAWLYIEAEMSFVLPLPKKPYIFLETVHSVLASFTDGQVCVSAWAESILYYWVI